MAEQEEIDYNKIGFKAGLEIHQQLEGNGKKLFCNCPSMLRKDEPDFTIHRKLHVVSGEGGEVDVAVKHEALKNKEFEYQGYSTTCLVELDEEPPHEINKEALKTALHIAILLNCKIIPLTQIMRKTVIDGSNTSGFQRTVMIARHGYVETSKGMVGIEAVYLEEDAARIVKREKDKVVFRLDRLGIPLVEISTSADIKSAEQAKETALKIGQILRSCKVKRGIGTIRQDVNMSVKKFGGTRIEIKGFQDIRNIEKTIENEIKRQLELINAGKEVKPEVRNALPNCVTHFLRPIPGKARMYPETDLPLLKIHKDFINEAKKTLPKLKEEVEEELKEYGLNEEMIKLLLKENKVQEFKELLKVLSKPQLVVKALLLFPKEIARKQGKSLEEIMSIIEDNLADVLRLVKKREILEGDVKDILLDLAEGKKLEEVLKKEKSEVNIEEEIMKLIKAKPGLSENAYMGMAMKELKGKADGREVMEIIKKYVK